MDKLRMIATDLDGTLLNSQLQLSQGNKDRLKCLKSQGVHLVLCTGRPFKGMYHLIDELGLDDDDYTVTYNGSLVQSCDGKRVLHCAEIATGHFLSLSHFFANYGLGLHAMTMDRIYTYNHEIHPLTVRESYLGNLPISVLSEEQYPQEKLIKLMAVGEPRLLDEAIKLFPPNFSQSFSLNKSEDFYLEIMQKGDNKAEALKLVLSELDLSADGLLAFGNNLNDLEMLQLAKVGVAVGNAVPALKEKSDFVTETNDRDGVAVFLESYHAEVHLKQLVACSPPIVLQLKQSHNL